MFFAYRQNNSYGRFVDRPRKGIGVLVIVEADSVKDANARAKGIGLYFNGKGDCPCCRSRWTAQYEVNDGTSKPTLYGSPVSLDGPTGNRFSDAGFVHYKAGGFRPCWS